MIKYNLEGNTLEVETEENIILIDVNKFLKVDLPTLLDKKDIGFGTEVYANSKLRRIYLTKMGNVVATYNTQEYLNLLHRVRRAHENDSKS